MSFRIPTPENNFGAENPLSLAVIDTFTASRVKPHMTPVPGQAQPGTWNVTATVDVYVSQSAYDKNKSPITSIQKTVNFDAPPSDVALQAEVIKQFDGAEAI